MSPDHTGLGPVAKIGLLAGRMGGRDPAFADFTGGAPQPIEGRPGRVVDTFLTVAGLASTKRSRCRQRRAERGPGARHRDPPRMAPGVVG